MSGGRVRREQRLADGLPSRAVGRNGNSGGPRVFGVRPDRFDHEIESAGAVDFARHAVSHVGLDEAGDFGRATSAGCPCTPRDTQSRLRSSACDIRCAAVSGTPARHRPAVGDETSMAESAPGSSGSAFRSYRRCRTCAREYAQLRDLETAVECLPRPRQSYC